MAIMVFGEGGAGTAGEKFYVEDEDDVEDDTIKTLIRRKNPIDFRNQWG